MSEKKQRNTNETEYTVFYGPLDLFHVKSA